MMLLAAHGGAARTSRDRSSRTPPGAAARGFLQRLAFLGDSLLALAVTDTCIRAGGRAFARQAHQDRAQGCRGYSSRAVAERLAIRS